MISTPIQSVIDNGGDIDLIIGLASDIWFLDTIATIQHHEMSTFRAIEYRKSLIRVATDGVTALIYPDGREMASLAPFTSGSLQVHAPILKGTTIYASFGKMLFDWLAIIIAIVGTLFLFFGRPRHDEKL